MLKEIAAELKVEIERRGRSRTPLALTPTFCCCCCSSSCGPGRED